MMDVMGHGCCLFVGRSLCVGSGQARKKRESPRIWIIFPLILKCTITLFTGQPEPDKRARPKVEAHGT